MATIKLTNSDLRKMINEAVSKLYEGAWYQAEPLCRLPYFVSVNFSDHAIDREYEREIDPDIIVDNLRKVIRDVIDDYDERKLGPESEFKIVDRDSCIVAVCGINASFNKKRIHRITVVTCYIWDGRFNIDFGKIYYINEPSVDYLEAKKWNEENQDKVIAFTDWKHDIDLKKLAKEADWEYGKRNPYYTPSHETLMKRMNLTYDNFEKSGNGKKKENPFKGLSKEDLEALLDYEKRFDKEKIELEPISEMVNRAVKQAIREHVRRNMNTNTSRRKTR